MVGETMNEDGQRVIGYGKRRRFIGHCRSMGWGGVEGSTVKDEWTWQAQVPLEYPLGIPHVSIIVLFFVNLNISIYVGDTY
jgi:hypothetical protein